MSSPMTNSLWVTDLWKSISSHLMTNSLWVILCILWKVVSSMTLNREWVTWHWIVWMAVSSHDILFFLWQTGSEWHCIFCERQLHYIFSYDQQIVSDVQHFVNDSLITSFSNTNSLWVTSQILWKAVSSHIILWLTGSGWYCTFCERQSWHDIYSYDWQSVSDIVHFGKVVSSHLFLWLLTGSEQHCTFC